MIAAASFCRTPYVTDSLDHLVQHSDLNLIDCGELVAAFIIMRARDNLTRQEKETLFVSSC